MEGVDYSHQDQIPASESLPRGRLWKRQCNAVSSMVLYLGGHLICKADFMQLICYIRDNMEILKCPSSQKGSYLLAQPLTIPMLGVTCSGVCMICSEDPSSFLPPYYISQNFLIKSTESWYQKGTQVFVPIKSVAIRAKCKMLLNS